MLVPLYVLAAGAILSGMLFYGSFFGHTDKVGAFYGIPLKGESPCRGLDGGSYRRDPCRAYGRWHGRRASRRGRRDGMPRSTATTTPPRHMRARQPTITAEAHGASTMRPLAARRATGAIYFGPDNHMLDDAHAAPVWVKVSPFVAMLHRPRPRLPDVYPPPRLAGESWPQNQKPLYEFLLNKWYFDEIYDAVFVNPARALGRFLWKKGDGATIDGGINGLAMGIIPWFTRLAGRAQSGYIFHYAFAMVIGIVILVSWMTIAGN